MKRLFPWFLLLTTFFSLFAFSACNDAPSSAPDEDIVYEKPENYLAYRAVEGFDYTEGDEIVKMTYYSSVAGGDKHANVVLPPDYNESKRYPVLYLLHGLKCDETAWTDGVYGFEMGAQYIVQNAHYFEGVPEMIVVCVNSLVNATETEPDWSIFGDASELAEVYDLTAQDITECLMPYVNSRFSTLTGKENTAIAGFSMGGREAVLTAFAHQDLFGWLGAFSPASFGENVVSSSDYVPDLTLDSESDGFGYVQLAVGILDTLKAVSDNLSERLDEIGVEHSYTVYLGSHDPSVWRYGLEEFVKNIFTTA